LKRKKQAIKEDKPKVPAYIVTFSDMTTLLLTFFVMLLSLSSMQDPDMFRKGRDSFRFSLDFLGLGTLLGREQRPDLGHPKIKYSIIEGDELEKKRNINTKEEDTRKLFKEISESMKTLPTKVSAKKSDFTVTNIHFAEGDSQLDESAKQFLNNFSSQLQQTYAFKPVRLYILGLASEQISEKQQWVLSARRAKAVSDYLQSTLSSGSGAQTQGSTSGAWSKWSIYWWGAGTGGDWVQQDSPISQESQILISVRKVEE
jgi:chemotaxis protein MotB